LRKSGAGNNLSLDDSGLLRCEKQASARRILEVLPVPLGAHETGGDLMLVENFR